MRDENVGSQATILAAKFKNQYEINRFLVSVLLEFTVKLVGELTKQVPEPSEPKEPEKVNKSMLSTEMKRAVADQVKREILKFRKQEEKGKVLKHTEKT